MKTATKEEARDYIEQLCSPMLEAEGYELVDAEWNRSRRGSSVRLFVHKDGGATIGDCQKAHKMVRPLLEVEGVLDDHTSLEVASPGLDRPLRKASDFRRAEGHFVAIRTRRPDDPRRENRLVGQVTAVEDETVILRLDNGETVSTPIAEVIEGRFDIRF